MAQINSLQKDGEQREQRLEQKIDLLTSQLKDNVQRVGTDVRSLQSEVAARIDTSALGLKSELSEVRKDIKDILVATARAESSMQGGFQSLEKMLALNVKAEVAQQIARSASQSGG